MRTTFHMSRHKIFLSYKQIPEQDIQGGFLGPMIADVRNYHIDNFRFPTL